MSHAAPPGRWWQPLHVVEWQAMRRLQRFELFTAILHGVQCIIVLVAILSWGDSFTVPLYIPYVTWPERGSADQLFTPKQFPDGSIDITLCLFGFFLLSFLFQLLAVTFWWTKFSFLLLEWYVQPFRWIEYSLSASLMAIVFAVLNGIRETTFLYNIFLEFFTCMMLGLIQEVLMGFYKRRQFEIQQLVDDDKIMKQKLRQSQRQGNQERNDRFRNEMTDTLNEGLQDAITFLDGQTDLAAKRTDIGLLVFLPHILGWFPFISATSVFMVSFSLAVSYGPSRPPAWVYCLYSFQFVIMSLFAVVQFYEQAHIFKAKTAEACRRYAIRAEFAYTVLSLLAKSVLCWVLFANMIAEHSIKY